MKRPPLTFTASHAMAAAPGGTRPGVTLDDYARHALDAALCRLEHGPADVE